jgi:excinuclease ABC subunit C
LSKLILKDSAAVSEDHLQDIKAVLDLKKIPAVIEGFDVSNIFGYHSVGAMVSFKNGKPDKNNFRRFKIKSTESINDYKMTAEIIRRRYKRLKEEKKRLPDLIIIDGGQGHLNLAKQTIKKLGLDIAIISIAKEKELIYLPHKKRPLNLPPNSKTLHLVQRIRDEAHRFAISYHHVLRNKMTKKSILKEIRGIGPKRYKNLINKFKNIDNIKQASWKELASVESMDKKSAKNIKQYFKKM